jgi:hypothetical protein
MRMNLRRGAMAGAAVALVVSAAIAARSSTPLQTFLLCPGRRGGDGAQTLAAVAFIDRRRRGCGEG